MTIIEKVREIVSQAVALGKAHWQNNDGWINDFTNEIISLTTKELIAKNELILEKNERISELLTQILGKDKIIEFYQAEHKNWISVDEMLPIEGLTVLIFDEPLNKDKAISTGQYIDDKFLTYPAWLSTLNVTHWQPLPQSPSEVQSEI